MADKTRTIKFYSDTAFSHFKDAAEWRHAENYMKINDAKLEIEFRGDIDAVLVAYGTDFGGVWKDGKA